ncbi:piggyBac transposable element-derived protein 4-like [Schistocerca piceifrons]|uniref:piggyBac transposable element-derived protein 4-like n=1 Tax=Schistocerca piceifrons TaxID=274613 RepID=UPI001F5ED579|nr:piggyBac transposable element-derived protein 4-like [Schistocerca piceifrons]
MDKRILQLLDEDNDDCVDDPDFSCSSKSDDSSASNTSDSDDSDQDNNEVSYVGDSTDNVVLWSKVDAMFRPLKTMPNMVIPAVLAKLDRSASELDVFEKIFSPSLFIFISQCTNQRLKLIKKTTVRSTDPGEIRLVLGVMLVMCYSRVPSFSDYWSHITSMGNVAIKRAIYRDRCKVLLSTLYFNFPDKPDTADKLYYLEPIDACLKNTFQKARSENTAQSIDESMIKFKGRSALKQYLPMKPVKRGIKIWMRSDSVTGYTYGFNIYFGNDANNMDGTLGERVVLQLSKTIRDTNVMLSFDIFFTSICLMDTLLFAAVDTCMANRKNVPKSTKKLARGECEFLCNSSGTLWCKWQDTEEVMLVSNCRSNDVCTVNKKAKDESKLVAECPVALKTYNDLMGGVDLADQMSKLYDLDRKSDKGWKKAFYKLLLTSAVNAWILKKKIQHKTVQLKHFLVNLTEQMIAKGQKTAKVQWKSSTGRPSKRARVNVF